MILARIGPLILKWATMPHKHRLTDLKHTDAETIFSSSILDLLTWNLWVIASYSQILLVRWCWRRRSNVSTNPSHFSRSKFYWLIELARRNIGNHRGEERHAPRKPTFPALMQAFRYSINDRRGLSHYIACCYRFPIPPLRNLRLMNTV